MADGGSYVLPPWGCTGRRARAVRTVGHTWYGLLRKGVPVDRIVALLPYEPYMRVPTLLRSHQNIGRRARRRADAPPRMCHSESVAHWFRRWVRTGVGRGRGRWRADCYGVGSQRGPMTFVLSRSQSRGDFGRGLPCTLHSGQHPHPNARTHAYQTVGAGERTSTATISMSCSSPSDPGPAATH